MFLNLVKSIVDVLGLKVVDILWVVVPKKSVIDFCLRMVCGCVGGGSGVSRICNGWCVGSFFKSPDFCGTLALTSMSFRFFGLRYPHISFLL